MKKMFWFDIFSERNCKRALYVLLPLLVLFLTYISVCDYDIKESSNNFRAMTLYYSDDTLKNYNEISPAVVRIIIYDKRGRHRGRGSGFFISKEGVLITNYHVIKRAYSAKVRTIDGEYFDIKGIIASNKKVDLVKLKVNTKGKNMKTLAFANELPGWDDETAVLGYPGGSGLTLSGGKVQAGAGWDGRISEHCVLFQISAPASHGNSGSPVLNSKGQVIGIVSRGKPTSYVRTNQGNNYDRFPLTAFPSYHHRTEAE
jgi:S1-C subfamily serine protease